MQVKGNSKAHFIKRWIKMRINARKNVIIVVVGATGSGKSWCSLSIAEEADPSFTLDRVCFSAQEFMSLLENGVDGKKLKPGQAIVFEEAGVGINSRKFFSLVNEVMYTVAETYRSSRLVTIFNLPAFDSMDKRVRQLTHALIETIDVIQKKNICLIKFFEIQTNPVSGKVYRKHLSDVGFSYDRHGIHKPSKELRDGYEIKKQEYRNELQIGLMKKLHVAASDEKRARKKKDINLDDIADDIRGNPGKFLKKYRGEYIVNYHKIMAEFGIGTVNAKVIAAKVEDEIIPDYPNNVTT